MIRRDRFEHGTPPNFDQTRCPVCTSKNTYEASPPFKPHGSYWAADVLCANCGHEWRASADPYAHRTDPEPDGSAGGYDT